MVRAHGDVNARAFLFHVSFKTPNLSFKCKIQYFKDVNYKIIAFGPDGNVNIYITFEFMYVLNILR